MNDGQPSPAAAAETRPRSYRGTMAYIYAFDLAYDMRREPLERLLGRPMQEYSIGLSKRNPRRLFFYRPQMVVLPPERRRTDCGTVEIQRSVKLFSVGALSIQVRVPFEVERIADLVAYHELRFATGSLEEEVRDLGERVREEVAPFCIRPAGRLGEGEAYTAFCLEALPRGPDRPALRAEQWLLNQRSQVAKLLMEEAETAHLSEQQVAGATRQYLSYFDDDVVVLDWDAALIVGAQDSLDDILHVMELANVQLVELAAYDRILDASLEASYRDVARRRVPARREVRHRLREIHVDLARLSDELGNITKFFGDWYLARIYQMLSGRFHLADWHRIIDEKLKTLGSLYELLQQDRVNFWMVMLEIMIVLLFIIDVIVLLAGL
ncbi:MAG TPA: hypothetical protein VFJ30_10485 [Phycisphaerae bacterium]|nr:hypothetical protein [Phycisphaerae bacterium]